MTKTVLVVDDDRQMVKTFAAVLSRRGWESVTAFDGDEAVKLAGERHVDVVLMDVRMPRMNGVDALRAMRRSRPLMPVILMTAYAAHDLLKQAELDGALSILPKPVPWPRLTALLDSAMQAEHGVLIVDDDPTFLSTLTEVVASAGRRVQKAETLSDALTLLATRGPDIVVLDLKLNGTPPIEAISMVREVRPGIVIIACSGYPVLLDDTLAALPSGAVYASLQKPFDPERLIALLGHLTNSPTS